MRLSRASCLLGLFLTGLSTLALAATGDRITSTIASGQMVPLTKTVHPLARSENDRGLVDPSFSVSYVTLITSPSPVQQQALNLLLAQQQNPKSPNYHKWLTPAQFADRFGLTRNDINRITRWLQAQGFEIVSVSGGRNTVIFKGTAAQIQSAFKTELHQYEVKGEQHFANSTPIMIPAALSGIVTGIRGVHDFRPKPFNHRKFAIEKARAHSNFYDNHYYFRNFLSPSDVATIYDINPLYTASITGTGRKLAIVGQTDILLADIQDFRSGFGLSPITGCTTGTVAGIAGIILSCTPSSTAPFQYVLVGSDHFSANDIGEADLDIEWSGAIAQNAQIIFVNGETSGGVFDALAYVIDNGPLAPVVSMSYGQCEAETASLETELQQGNAEGLTIMNSSGDRGAAGCDFDPPNSTPPFEGAVGGIAVSYPASSPEVTGVGGTGISLADDSYPNPSSFWTTNNGTSGTITYGETAVSYIPETAWNDNEQFPAFCTTVSPLPAFCDPSPGVPATSAQALQEDYWISSGGGGFSNCNDETVEGVCTAGFPKPSWQTVTISGQTTRLVPDVSLLASPNFPGYIFCTPQDPSTANYTSTCVNGIFDAVDTYTSVVGGTSVSSPVFAGIVTLISQALASTTGLGNINPTLYQLAQTPSNKAFNPVNVGDNNVYCQAGQPSIQPAALQCPSAGVLGFSATNKDSTTGYNLVTGLGSVDANNLATAWEATLAQFTLSAGTSNPTSVSAGTTTTATITVTPKTGFTGTVTFSCPNAPAGTSCTNFNPPSVSGGSGSTTVTIQTAANMLNGATSVPVEGTSGGSTSTPVTFTVTPTTESFTLTSSLSGGQLQVAQGAMGSVPITVNGVNGFTTTTLPLTYTCTLPASETTCTGPTTGSTATSVSFNIQTTAPTARLERPLDRGARIFYAMLLPGLFGIVLTFSSRKRGLRMGGMKMLGFIVVLGFSTLWLGSCGGSNSNPTSNPGTPTGQYKVLINATTGGAVPLTGTITVTLSVTAAAK